MRANVFIGLLLGIMATGCDSRKQSEALTDKEEIAIQALVQANINDGLEATRVKDIDNYMKGMPDDFVIYDESGEIISKEKQREYVLRDWAIIDTTLSIKVDVDSIHYLKRDSIIVFTSQAWLRMMFQRDGITKDTVLTTQKHREVWRKNNDDWFGYEIEELGGKIYINGERYNPN